MNTLCQKLPWTSVYKCYKCKVIDITHEFIECNILRDCDSNGVIGEEMLDYCMIFKLLFWFFVKQWNLEALLWSIKFTKIPLMFLGLDQIFKLNDIYTYVGMYEITSNKNLKYFVIEYLHLYSIDINKY